MKLIHFPVLPMPHGSIDDFTFVEMVYPENRFSRFIGNGAQKKYLRIFRSKRSVFIKTFRRRNGTGKSFRWDTRKNRMAFHSWCDREYNTFLYISVVTLIISSQNILIKFRPLRQHFWYLC